MPGSTLPGIQVLLLLSISSCSTHWFWESPDTSPTFTATPLHLDYQRSVTSPQLRPAGAATDRWRKGRRVLSSGREVARLDSSHHRKEHVVEARPVLKAAQRKDAYRDESVTRRKDADTHVPDPRAAAEHLGPASLKGAGRPQRALPKNLRRRDGAAPFVIRKRRQGDNKAPGILVRGAGLEEAVMGEPAVVIVEITGVSTV